MTDTQTPNIASLNLRTNVVCIISRIERISDIKIEEIVMIMILYFSRRIRFYYIWTIVKITIILSIIILILMVHGSQHL